MLLEYYIKEAAFSSTESRPKIYNKGMAEEKHLLFFLRLINFQSTTGLRFANFKHIMLSADNIKHIENIKYIK